MLDKHSKHGAPSNEEMVQTSAHHTHRHAMRHQHELVMDDVDNTDILAFSAQQIADDEEPLAFASGGAIMDALAQADPGLKSSPKKK